MDELNMYLEGKDDYKLCYVEKNFAYFTNLALSKQWGDDWDDICYSDNAGEPYYDDEYQIIKIAYDGQNSYTPQDLHYGRYSVKMINSGAIAWITGNIGNKYIAISAGATIREFIEKVTELEENVYLSI